MRTAGRERVCIDGHLTRSLEYYRGAEAPPTSDVKSAVHVWQPAVALHRECWRLAVTARGGRRGEEAAPFLVVGCFENENTASLSLVFLLPECRPDLAVLLHRFGPWTD
jgi:hypothetical protein